MKKVFLIICSSSLLALLGATSELRKRVTHPDAQREMSGGQMVFSEDPMTYSDLEVVNIFHLSLLRKLISQVEKHKSLRAGFIFHFASLMLRSW
jgi:hypothetical protein